MKGGHIQFLIVEGNRKSHHSRPGEEADLYGNSIFDIAHVAMDPVSYSKKKEKNEYGELVESKILESNKDGLNFLYVKNISIDT